MKQGEVTFMLLLTCPVCQFQRARSDALEDGSILKAGDITFCYACGAILFLDPNLELRLPTAQENHFVENDPELMEIIAKIRKIIR